MEEGHCGLPTSELLTKAEELLSVSQALLNEALQEEHKNGALIQDRIASEEMVFLKGLYQAETQVARLLKQLLKGSLPWEENLEVQKAIFWVEESLKLTLGNSQKEAIYQTLNSKVMVIT